MERRMQKICFISSNPDFIGGMTLYLKNFLKYLENIKFNADISWVYLGKENKEYIKDKIKYIEIKSNGPYPLSEIIFNLKLVNYFKKNYFDIINIHATNGFWMAFYKKRQNQKIISTYHGTTAYYYKNHLKRFSFLKKIIFYPLVSYGKFIEAPPAKKSDDIICVSEKVREQFFRLFGKRENVHVLRSGVDIEIFKIRNKKNARKKLKLKNEFIYGLYVGRGGFYTKGLDRVIRLSERIYELDRDYRLIIIGPDKEKVQHLLKKDFIIFLPPIRETLVDYYNSADIFFCFSRYEGGAPILAVSEAMASGCLPICSEDSKQEVIKNEKNGLIFGNYSEKEASKVLEILKDKNKLKKLLLESQKTVREISLDKWGRKYLNVLIN